MRCNVCGYELVDGAPFCPCCGAELTVAQEFHPETVATDPVEEETQKESVDDILASEQGTTVLTQQDANFASSEEDVPYAYRHSYGFGQYQLPPQPQKPVVLEQRPSWDTPEEKARIAKKRKKITIILVVSLIVALTASGLLWYFLTRPSNINGTYDLIRLGNVPWNDTLKEQLRQKYEQDGDTHKLSLLDHSSPDDMKMVLSDGKCELYMFGERIDLEYELNGKNQYRFLYYANGMRYESEWQDIDGDILYVNLNEAQRFVYQKRK